MRIALAALALTLPLAAPAAASVFTLEQTAANVHGTNGRTTVTITSTTPSVGPQSTSAGGFDLRVKAGDTSGIAPLDAAAKFVAWCLDIAKTLSLPSSYAVTTAPFAAQTLASQQKADIRRLFDTGYDTTMLGNDAYSAGFQIALWEIVNETSGSYDVNAGTFTVTNGGAAGTNARTVATNLLGGLGGPVVNTGFRVVYLESQDMKNPVGRDSQNLVTVAPVPLPAAGLMLLAALGGVAALRRRKAA
ncbi:MAG: VPLPA-CTERM sorting domain-containing protein [Gemmobacter sp.]